MTTVNFCYWLQGFFELHDDPAKGLNPAQKEIIRQHLAMVFKHDIDPRQGSVEHQAELQKLHDGLAQANADIAEIAKGPTLYRC